MTIDEKSGEISVWNNGKGVPVEMHSVAQMYVPEFVFGNMRTGSNYDVSGICRLCPFAPLCFAQNLTSHAVCLSFYIVGFGGAHGRWSQRFRCKTDQHFLPQIQSRNSGQEKRPALHSGTATRGREEMQ